jgi:flavin-dependent dehydrogenase
MWGISRTALDVLLLSAAARAGATVLQPARCEKLHPGEPPSVSIRDLASNAVDRLTADWILVADGKSALLNGRAPPPTDDFGIKTHFEHVDGPRDAIELFGLTGCYGGLAPIEGGRWNCALSVPAERVRRHHGDLGRLFAELVGENAALKRRLAGARQVGAWVASPLPRFRVRDDWPAGVIPIGNAAAAIEPIGGEGMGLALRSAELASRTLIDLPARNLRHTYATLWRKRQIACRFAATLASSPAWANMLAPALRAAPWVLRPALSLMKE